MTTGHLAATPAFHPPRTEAASAAAPVGCAALSDAPESLRGELLSPERLGAHASELARAHGLPVFLGSPGKLRARFVEARAQIRASYEALNRQAAIPHDPSPAEEWLLDNVHVVEDQLREIEEDLPRSYLNELPRLREGPLSGFPRTYTLCLDYLRHTDARIDQATLVPYVAAYQQVVTLTIGELWAVPIMLRIGLVLSVGAIAAREADATVRIRADRLARELLAAGPDSRQLPTMLARLDRQPISAALLVQLMHKLREHESAPVAEWIARQAAALGMTADELTRQQHLKQAGDQVSVGNAITSMRAIAALDWNRFFERTSAVEAVLRQDPAGAYSLTDAASRDRYRHVVERVSRRSELDEQAIAQAAVELAQKAHGPDTAEGHVGFYLIDDGLKLLSDQVHYRPRLAERWRGWVLDHPIAAYLGALNAVSAALLYLALVATDGGLGPVGLVALVLLLVLPASEIALTAVNALVTAVLPPRTLPKLDFKKGIPKEHATLVVVPSMLESEAAIAKLVEDLEVRSLANTDAALGFALLTDFIDRPQERHGDDARLVQRARDGIAGLNRRHCQGSEERYFLLHRSLRFNPLEGAWMGWERKRGKLEELNRLLRGATDTSFSVVTATKEQLARVRYVITLDSDTALPREVGRKLVSAMAHPLNRPRFDPGGCKVVRGYGLIQPRVGTRPISSRVSRFARIAAGQAGLDPYTTAVSDVYQDLFSEGSYVGKGIYDVDAFARALNERVPENALLSHDLFEGVHVRTALATDIEVLDDQPSSYASFAARQHRWVRGDWQLLPWLGSSVPHAHGPSKPSELSTISRWRFLDNLRRSLLAPALIALQVLGWVLGPRCAAVAIVALLGVIASPLLSWATLTLLRPGQRHAASRLALLRAQLPLNSAKALLSLMFLLDQAVSMLDAIARTLVRLYWSKRHLLEWATLGELERRTARGGTAARLALGSVASALGLVALAFFARGTLPFAAPLLSLWALTPLLARVLAEPIRTRDLSGQLKDDERRMFRRVARKTWGFFETFVTAEDQWLPPDNFQQEPRAAVAHRTSPTNIGLYLLSTLAARDLGFITLRNLADRWHDTLGAIDRLEKREGHLLNWYETTTLRPLEPRYVSTVDSGNLAAYLWTLAQACADLLDRPLVGQGVCDGALDALRLDDTEATRTNPLGVEPAAMQTLLEQARLEVGDLPATAAALERLITALPRSSVASNSPAATPWADRVAGTLRQTALELQTLAPWARSLAGAPHELETSALAAPWATLTSQLRSLQAPREIAAAMPEALAAVEAMQRQLAPTSRALDGWLGGLRGELDRSRLACEAMADELGSLGTRAVALADAMNFRFLYDDDRSLFAIGYDVSASRLDGSFYDLLASEARLSSLVAIAKGDAPLRHWFHLGRPRGRLDTGRVLLSWSGSMFEYLMPLLVTRCPPATLLDESCRAAIDRQREYGRERQVPWGVSESAYNTMDLSMTYQYRAFGVPGLGLKAGLESDLVVAPYATVLAALLSPQRAAKNLLRLAEEGLEGPFGLYESIDFTPAHLPPGKSSVVVKALFAHHQGMSLVALADVLCGSLMQRRFHRDLRVRATELLLEERVPVEAPMVETRPQSGPKSAGNEPGAIVLEHAGLATEPLRLQVLGHGDLSTVVSTTGTGFTTWQGKDLYRYREDLIEPSGLFVYLRDVERGATWSAGYEPLRRRPGRYDVTFGADRVELHRRDADIDTLMEIVVSAERPAEVRRLTLTNHGTSPRTLELTTYTEVVLAPRAADLAHRAFSSMFVHTERSGDAVLVSRRNRPTEPPSHLVQLLTPETGVWRDGGVETSRARFIGRGHTVRDPVGLMRPLSGTVGDVLDPIVALRRRVRLEPGERACVSLITALATSAESARDHAAYFRSPHSIARTFELGWADARVELRHLGIDGAQAQRHQRLLSLMLYPRPQLRASPHPGTLRGRTRDALWAQGISGDLPIVVLRLDHGDFAALTTDLLLAHEFWRLNGIACDLVLLDDEPPSYLQPLQHHATALVDASPAHAQQNQPGGVFVRRGDQLTPDARALLLGAARVVLNASAGSLNKQLRSIWKTTEPPPPASYPAAPPGTAPPHGQLLFDNGLGGFSPDGKEYVLTVGPDSLPPAPFSNVIANESFGCVVTERGGGYTWAVNSQTHRLTPWSNDPVSDPVGEAVYLRDRDTGALWSATPGPAGGVAKYRVRHGQGYSIFEHTRGGLEQALEVFVSAKDPVKVSRLRLVNRSGRARRLTISGAIDWVMGSTREASATTLVTELDEATQAVFAQNPAGVAPEARAFFCATERPSSGTADREELFGRDGSRARPRGLDQPRLSGRAGGGLDPCAALSVELELAPGETRELAFALGEGRELEHARALVRDYSSLERVDAEWHAARAAWDERLSRVRVKTPEPALDLLVNRWLPYQVLSARLWGRSGFYQSGGAYGFRDQLQDVLALIHLEPQLVRDHLLRAAARQFVEGDVQHWWHPETGEGVRTRCSDDMLWLPYAVAAYVNATGDRAVLDEQVSWLEGRGLKPEENDLMSTPPVSGARASLYAHCLKAIAVGNTRGPQGLPLIGSGDWNDGLDRVGRGGRGESVWLGWFLVRVLQDFTPLAEARGDGATVDHLAAEVARLTAAIERSAWDGEWYSRATFDDGTVMGSKASEACRIDAIAQSWAVIAGTGDLARASQALASSERLLFEPKDLMMKLFTPPFEGGAHDPGYIAAYPPGVRENGGQYTHGVLWTALARVLLGDGDGALRLLSAFNPIHHASNPAQLALYAVEPYVMAADVYAPSGRGGWTWYTGSAGWMYRIVLEHLLGVRLHEGRLTVSPTLPREWPGFELRYHGATHVVAGRGSSSGKGD